MIFKSDVLDQSDLNLTKYSDPEVVDVYAKWEGLQSCERLAFRTYINDGEDILDIGVGGGRTTPFLAAKAKSYLGVDYSEGMVEASRKRFPASEFQWADATDLSAFEDNSFDVAVFSFNGIDVIQSIAGRAKCFSEVMRILRPGGRFIFSSHNARGVGSWPLLTGAHQFWILLRCLNAARGTLKRFAWLVRSAAFWTGSGYVLDSAHGGTLLLYTSPKYVRSEAERAGFEVLEIIAETYPDNPPNWFAHWFYYVVKKPEAA